MTGKLRKFFFAQRSRVLQALTELKAPVELPLQTGVDQVFNCARENKQLEQILGPLLTDQLPAETTELKPGANLSGALAEPAVAKGLADLASINQLTRAQLAETLKHGLAAEETADLLAARVKAVFNHACNDRAEPIARAQTLSKMAAGRDLALKPVLRPEPTSPAGDDTATHNP
jgi:hypothetical protein